MFKIHKKKIPKSVFLPDGIPKPEFVANPNDYWLSYRISGDHIIAEVIFFKIKEVYYYKYTGKYWLFLNKHVYV